MWQLRTYGAPARASKALVLGLGLWAAPALAEPVDILALGDSLTQGYGLPEADGFAPQLGEWLDARGHEVRLVNGGVSGDTTTGGLSRVEWSLTSDIDAMIVALGGNDLLRGIDPALSRSNLERILAVAQEHDVEVLLIGMQAPGNYGRDYKQAFDSMYPELAETYGTLYLESFFSGLQQDGAVPGDLSRYMQADGIHPNAKGVAQIVEAVGPKVEGLIDRVRN